MNPLGADFTTFNSLTEPLKWEQDKSPHRQGTFGGAVVQSVADSQTAGHPDGYIHGDEFHVYVSDENAFISDIVPGDTIERIIYRGEKLTVQQITRKPIGYMLVCSANERPIV